MEQLEQYKNTIIDLNNKDNIDKLFNEYKRLNEKCDKIILKIKERKAKKK